MHLTRESVTRGTAVASENRIGIMPVGGGTVPAHGAAGPAPTAALRARAHDFLSLTKPRVLVLVLIATGLGCVMAAASLDVFALAHALLGTALVAGGTAALNQYSERAHDARMRRTARRPLPAGRLQPQEVLRFGLGLSLAGTVYLAVTLNLLTSLVGLAALLSYLVLYTPLKRRSGLCTLVGACPGAAPVLMGWAAVRGDLAPEAWVLYAILFLWQFPHFLAIGWLYREDYARAGMRMIPAGDGTGRATFGLIQLTAQALVAVSFLPTLMGMAGLAALFIAIASPLHAYADLLLTAHMLQHMLLMLIVPPLLLAGAPYLPLLRGLPRRFVKHGLGPFLAWPALWRCGRRLTHPLTAWLAFVLTSTAWHVPALYELALRTPGWHAVEHLCFVATALLFWWPVMQPWPSRPQGPRWVLLPYLFLADVQNTILAAFLTFCERVLYPTYATAPRLTALTALDDQAAAGAIMWVLGSVAFLIPAGCITIQVLQGPRVAVRPVSGGVGASIAPAERKRRRTRDDGRYMLRTQ